MYENPGEVRPPPLHPAANAHAPKRMFSCVLFLQNFKVLALMSIVVGASL